ncbi:MAG: peptidoglycan D,D-transpeptidase FtsI family protein [Huintestinicola sp.]
MYSKRMKGRLAVFAGIMAVMFSFLMARLALINIDSEKYSAFDMSAPKKVTVICSYGDIFDRNGVSLVNAQEHYMAIINPEAADRDVLDKAVVDREKYDACIDGSALFLCEVDSPNIDGAEVITVKDRYLENQPAAHLIGYLSEGHGVCGIEKSYDDILRNPRSAVTVSYSADAGGNFLEGGGIEMKWTSGYETGVLTAVDADIQRVAENAMSNVSKGAAVVMDIKTGEICAVVSKPVFDPIHPEKSLDDEDSPFIDRALCSYSVGSVFKLVTAGAALEYGISEEYSYNCTGSIDVLSSEFGCHLFGGHGNVDMRMAMTESCNPYFISLGQDVPTSFLHDFAERLGFGTETILCEDIYSAAGNLPSERELAVPEEKANFCFGQGKLTATPLQVTMMTAAIANGGMQPYPVLIHGTTDIAHSTVNSTAIFRRVMSEETADKLKSFMVSALHKQNSVAVPENTDGGGKTSTAQTWRYNEDGSEVLNCWFTGFFPENEPRYAVTVMIENGISGNVTCGPVFKEIAEEVTDLMYRNNADLLTYVGD